LYLLAKHNIEGSSLLSFLQKKKKNLSKPHCFSLQEEYELNLMLSEWIVKAPYSCYVYTGYILSGTEIYLYLGIGYPFLGIM
jgi:hypothetical protein